MDCHDFVVSPLEKLIFEWLISILSMFSRCSNECNQKTILRGRSSKVTTGQGLFNVLKRQVNSYGELATYKCDYGELIPKPATQVKTDWRRSLIPRDPLVDVTDLLTRPQLFPLW